MRFRKQKQSDQAEESGLGVAERVSAHFVPPSSLPDETAYRLVEEARLRAEQRLEGLQDEAERRRWRCVHRELGIAGYLLSTEIPPRKRQALLERAREQSRELGRRHCGEEHAILRLIVAAASSAVEALLVPVLADHVQLATEHLAHARQLLLRLLLADDRTPLRTA